MELALYEGFNYLDHCEDLNDEEREYIKNETKSIIKDNDYNEVTYYDEDNDEICTIEYRPDEDIISLIELNIDEDN